MENLIITNQDWFKKYLLFRKIVLIVMFGAILLIIKPNIVTIGLKSMVLGVSISILLTLLLFNFIQHPSYFDLRQSSEKIIIGLYIPDTRYFFNFHKNKIKTFDINKGDEVLFHFNYYTFGLMNNLILKVRKENGEIFQFKPINISWANQESIKKIVSIFEEHNKKFTID